MTFGKNVLHVNVHQLMEILDLSSRWQPRCHFTQTSAAAWCVHTQRLQCTCAASLSVPDLQYICVLVDVYMYTICVYDAYGWRYVRISLCTDVIRVSLSSFKTAFSRDIHYSVENKEFN